MDKIIRATITVEVPYSNELLNDGTKLDKELRKVINNTKFIPNKNLFGIVVNSSTNEIEDTTNFSHD